MLNKNEQQISSTGEAQTSGVHWSLKNYTVKKGQLNGEGHLSMNHMMTEIPVPWDM